MTIDLSCQKCDASFELDAGDVIDGSEAIKCPNCDAKAPQGLVDDFANALGETCKAIVALSKKFGVTFALETDDLPSQFDEVEKAAADDEDEEDDDEDDALDDDDEDEDDSDDEDDDDEGAGGEGEL